MLLSMASLREILKGIGKRLKPPGNRGDGAGTQEQHLHPGGGPPGAARQDGVGPT